MSSKCLLRRTGREELNRFASLISGTESVVHIRQSPDLLPLFWSIFASLAFPLYSISHYDPFRMHLLWTVNNNLLSHSSLSNPRAPIKNNPDSGVSRDQHLPGSLLERVREGSRSREPGLRSCLFCMIVQSRITFSKK
jgi:hypothetical protein